MEKQKETRFEPSPKMLQVLEAAINSEVAPSISAWCKAAGVSRSQWYRWQGVEGFTSWFNGEFKKSLEGIRTALVKIGLQKALEGDFQFWKVMMEKTGEYGESLRVEQQGVILKIPEQRKVSKMDPD